MHESEIKKQCKLTWALNHGEFNTHTETGRPLKVEKPVGGKSKRPSMKRPADVSIDEWEEVKAELSMYHKYARSLKCRGGDVRRAHDNGSRIAKGLEAGAIIARVESQGPEVKLWSYLAYKEETITSKRHAFLLLASWLIDDYMAKRSLKPADRKRITLITLCQLNSELNQYDKRFPAPKSTDLGDYKDPRGFKHRYKSIFADVQQMIRQLDEQAKAGAGNARKRIPDN